MNLFDTLLNPDRDEFPNRTVVSNAANLLDVGEFQFLQLAFVHWHGRDMRQDEIDAIFNSFMVHSEVPGWALLYARDICQLDRVGELDSADPAYHRFDVAGTAKARVNPRAGFIAAMVFLVGTLGGALAIAAQTAECAGEFPPCLSSSEITGPIAK
ncbi:MAG: hypothetical protein HOK21_12275 [Rhodospirillaceae bacterium]|jgi:hypothetical protein|nr:hypothetical protein [Rhodospirillaceae bacterium]MBT4686598.1 hypothetical protein [Rhodospirillaceae bacterium]MBT5081625.1 hypothetical protein [Rhodospirillaceae bacterium]MBT5524859.1 hypothetical protein [Rhodospirillaceae bacterium]MBT5881100.1 hypothetical protein [Rhodospirillaceae bacterium]